MEGAFLCVRSCSLTILDLYEYWLVNNQEIMRMVDLLAELSMSLTKKKVNIIDFLLGIW